MCSPDRHRNCPLPALHHHPDRAWRGLGVYWPGLPNGARISDLRYTAARSEIKAKASTLQSSCTAEAVETLLIPRFTLGLPLSCDAMCWH
eukprot:3938547-Rhodomonas_salina.1